MKHSEFWTLMNDEFGPGYARSVARDQELSAIGGRTPLQALDAGVPVKAIWEAVCDAMEVPPERWAGKQIPPRRR